MEGFILLAAGIVLYLLVIVWGKSNEAGDKFLAIMWADKHPHSDD